MTAAAPHPRTRYRRDLDDALLAAAATMVARGDYPALWMLALELGECNSTVRRHRDSLVARGLWPWEVREAGVRGPGRPKDADPPTEPDESEVRQLAADLRCAAFEGHAHPLKDDEAPAWSYRRRPGMVGPPAAVDLRRICLKYRLEWRAIVRGTPPRMKVCSGCGEPRPVGSFSIAATAADGLDSRCRACQARRHRERTRRAEGVARA